MIRPILTELALFATPFAVYALFIWATREGFLDPVAWSPQRLAWLTITALVLMIGSFVFFAEFTGAPPDSSYVPAHVENGRVVPGSIK
jgi:heme/copper-type cytochrome/quinol oxidase subunit 3